MAQEKIPQATAKRLPLYYRVLQHLSESGKQRISSSELSEVVKIDSATIRRDFSHFGALGKKGYGYHVERLLSFLRNTLNQDELTKVMLIGVGNLGTALLNYNFLKNNNIKIVKAYDTNAHKVGTMIGETSIHHIDQLATDDNHDISVAILTVPAEAAQSVAETLVSGGVNGILNFTPVRLSLPKDIRVHHIDLAVELQTLVYFLNNFPLKNQGGE
ncbi:redox-sensing transcriptional repressor [Pullulanibacillus pueri]|uniref:Redox-sensing transcriptional repressor Rex n=1 Tax=Pullulanibacillus pueri TaxID=1437324 RepID=A0A8J3EMM0_9BACL|nr:redox-sensing transcriptional repressor Rex [Pullulanibacillus pueri]MBM7682833.1 redox-sensing transcriptional repressor [Pullulanibacillus pueri]GGH83373.1 redox-sensing transcriptional repressor Rex [Pullulanibacillus pueri]